MATGTGNLPYGEQSVDPFDTITAAYTNQTFGNINSLASGTGIGDKAVGLTKLNGGATAGVLTTTSAGVVSASPKIATVTEAVSGEVSITTGSYKSKGITLAASTVYAVHCSIEWLHAGGGNKRIVLRCGGSEIDSHRIEGTVQTNMTLFGVYSTAVAGTVTFDIYITNVAGTTTGTLGYVRYSAVPIVSSGII